MTRWLGYLCLLVFPMLAFTARVSWDEPTRSCDGSLLTDLVGVKIHFGKVSRASEGLLTEYPDNYDACRLGPHVHDFDYEFETAILTESPVKLCPVEPGTYYMAATAWDSAGKSSAYTEELIFTNTGDECTTVAPTLLDLF